MNCMYCRTPSKPEQKVMATHVVLVIQAATGGMDDLAVAVFRRMGRRFGADAAIVALSALAGMAAAPVKEAVKAEGTVFGGYQAYDIDGNKLDGDAVPYPVGWAGRMVCAAVVDDWDTTLDLITEAIEQGHMDECLPELARCAGAAKAEGAAA